MVLHLIFEGLSPSNYLIRRSILNPNTMSRYQRAFFQKFFFISLLILTKSSALFIPLASSELRSDQLCPNPIDFQGTHMLQFFPIPSRVFVMDLMRSENATWSRGEEDKDLPKVQTPIPCQFRFFKVRETKFVTLVTLQQRRSLFTFDKKCSGILEFPDIRGEGSGLTCETEEVNHEEDKTIVASDGKFEIRITQKKIVKFMTRQLQFELPSYEGPSGYYPYLTALFRITSNTGDCYIQLQQYYWTSWSNDSSKCSSVLKRKLLHNICGQYECSQETKLINELKENDMGSPYSLDELPPFKKMRTIGYFLKGLLLPLLISISATLGYIIWRRRAKQARLLALRTAIDGMPVSLGVGTQTLGVFPVLDEHGNLNLIELEDDYIGEGGEMARHKPYTQDKPPTYESIVDPPTYAEALHRLLPRTDICPVRMDIDDPYSSSFDPVDLHDVQQGQVPYCPLSSGDDGCNEVSEDKPLVEDRPFLE